MMQVGKRLVIMLAALILILLVPAISMQFTNEVDWTTADFVSAAIGLLILIACIEIVLRFVRKRFHRWVILTLVFILFLLLWMEAAVGIFDSPITGS